MIEMLFLLIVMLAGGVFFLGAGAVYLVLLLAFKALWFGVQLVFSLGKGAVIVAVLALLLLFKFAGTLVMLAMIGAVLFGAWVLLSAAGSRARRPAGSYSYEYRQSAYSGHSMREATIGRLNAALNRMEDRMADLENEMRRRKW